MVSTKVLFVLLAVASGVVVAGGLAGFGVRRGAIDSFQETLDTMHDDETLEDTAYSSLGTKVTDLENTMKGAETLVGFHWSGGRWRDCAGRAAHSCTEEKLINHGSSADL